MKINCLSCGHKVDLDHAYDDYEGQVKCFACGAILEMKTEHGELRSVKFMRIVPRPSAAEVLERAAR